MVSASVVMSSSTSTRPRAAAQRRDLADHGVVHATIVASERELELLREVGARAQYGLERGVAQTPGDGSNALEGAGELEELRREPPTMTQRASRSTTITGLARQAMTAASCSSSVADPLVDVGGAQRERGVAGERAGAWRESGLGRFS